MNFVVNSPVLDPRIATAVRAMWKGRVPRRTLAARLARDLEETPAALRLRRRAGAAERLAYYFPEEAAGFVATQVDALRFDPPSAAAPEKVDGPDARDLLLALATERSGPISDAVARAVPRMRYDALAVGRRLVGRPEQALAERLTRWIGDPKAAAAPGAPSFRADLLSRDRPLPGGSAGPPRELRGRPRHGGLEGRT